MNKAFGRQTISATDEKTFEKTFDMVLRYRDLESAIQNQKKNPLAPGPEAIEARYQEAKKRERGAYRSTITEVHKYPYRKAFESMKGLTMTLDEMSTELDNRKLQLDLAPEGPQP